MLTARPSSKVTLQGIIAIVMTIVSAGAAALNDGITLEAGPAAGLVGAGVALLVALGYLKNDNRPSPSAVESLFRDGFIDDTKVVALRQRGLLKPKN